MKHLITVNGSQRRVALTGKIYAHDAGRIRDELLEEIEHGATDIQIDLSKTDYIDSTGLGVLVTSHKRLLAVNGKLALTGVNGLVAELLKRTRLDRVLTVE